MWLRTYKFCQLNADNQEDSVRKVKENVIKQNKEHYMDLILLWQQQHKISDL